MYGVQVAALALTCLVTVILLLTAPVWMRVLTTLAARLWQPIERADDETALVEREFPREEK